MAKIVFVGSNPSNASVPSSAFHGSTRSAQILAQWTKDIDQSSVKTYVNVVEVKTDKNRPLKTSEIKANLSRLIKDVECADKIIALGKTAAKALSMLGVSFYEMPHPSGRNRLLNDPKYVEQKVKGLLQYCSEEGLNSSLTKS
jgi:hypothetical protein